MIRSASEGRGGTGEVEGIVTNQSGGKPSAILLGSKPGAVVALEILINRRWQVEFVVVPKAAPPEWIGGPTVAEVARANGIRVVLQKELPDDAETDFVISYMYRNLVSPRTLNMASRGAFNFHAAPLPEFGGWAFYNVAILERRDEYGVTAHWMDEGFDTGPLFKVRTFGIDPDVETALSLETRAQEEMILLFDEFCAQAERDESLPKTPQEPNHMRYMSREEFEPLRKIPDDSDAETIDRYARAFWYPPYDCAWTTVNGNRIEVVPQVAKAALARRLHSTDVDQLRARLAAELSSHQPEQANSRA